MLVHRELRKKFAPDEQVNRTEIHSYLWAAFFASFLADQERRETILLGTR
jgi:hypothetical protein